MASWIGIAATDESTPPDNPADNFLSPTWAHFCDGFLTKGIHCPIALTAANFMGSFNQCCAMRRCIDFGVEFVRCTFFIFITGGARCAFEIPTISAFRQFCDQGHRGTSRTISFCPISKHRRTNRTVLWIST